MYGGPRPDDHGAPRDPPCGGLRLRSSCLRKKIFCATRCSPPGRAPSGAAELLWLGAGAGARKKEISCFPYASPALGEGREKLEGAKSLLRRDAGTSREAIISSHPQTSPSRVTSPEARSSCGRDFGRSCCRPAPAGARLSEAPSCSTPREGAGRAQASATRRRIKRILQTSSLARQKDQTEL